MCKCLCAYVCVYLHASMTVWIICMHWSCTFVHVFYTLLCVLYMYDQVCELCVCECGSMPFQLSWFFSSFILLINTVSPFRLLLQNNIDWVDYEQNKFIALHSGLSKSEIRCDPSSSCKLLTISLRGARGWRWPWSRFVGTSLI